MNYEDFKSKFADVMKDPAGKADVATELLADVATVFEGFDALTKQAETNTARIKELETTNQRLFLSITGKPAEGEGGDDDAEELTGADAINKFWSDLDQKGEN